MSERVAELQNPVMERTKFTLPGGGELPWAQVCLTIDVVHY
jgi:hypothetical protein